MLPVNDGFYYVIGAFYGPNDEDSLLRSVSDADGTLPVFYHGARLSESDQFMQPTEFVRLGADGDDAGFFGPNFLFVPEPSSMTGFCSGLLMLATFVQRLRNRP
jgi:hypothetical protein